jgi:serine/threonine-protein kinase
MAQARARVEQEPAAPTGACADAGPALIWGLAREAVDRPRTAKLFVDELEAALAGEAGLTRVMPRRVASAEWTDRPRFGRDALADTTAHDVDVAAARPDAVAVPVPVAAAASAEARRPVRREPPPDPVARSRSPHRKAFMLAGLAVACVTVGAGAALIGDNGNDGGRDVAAPRAVSSKPQGSAPPSKPSATAAGAAATPATPQPGAGASSSAPSGTATAQTPATPAPDDGRSAAAIDNAGYAMLPGNPQGALPLLARAVEKFRAAGDTSSTDYAFSLYNYGWALRLAGRPAEAIPFLEERLQISNFKRGIVRKELKTAQKAAAAG